MPVISDTSLVNEICLMKSIVANNYGNNFLGNDSLACPTKRLYNLGPNVYTFTSATRFALASPYLDALIACYRQSTITLRYFGLEFRCAFLDGRIMRVNRDKPDFGSQRILGSCRNLPRFCFILMLGPQTGSDQDAAATANTL